MTSPSNLLKEPSGETSLQRKNVKIELKKSDILNALYQNKLGLKSGEDQFKPCPVTLKPWKISKTLFRQAQLTAQSLSLLFTRVSMNHGYLKKALEDYSADSSLLFKLKEIAFSQQPTIAKNLNLIRQDFLLDAQLQWRLVEANSIAAGMGPFNDKLVNIQQSLTQNNATQFAPNSALKLQAAEIYKAASNSNRNQNPLVVFVIQENEDNIYDQELLANALQELGAIVMRKTLNQLATELKSKSKKLYLADTKKVDLFYFRTGYNLADYSLSNNKKNNINEQKRILKFRNWIEHHETNVCPKVEMQIATSKWVQMKLSKLTKSELSDYFFLSDRQALLVYNALKVPYTATNDTEVIRSKLNSGNWLLKSQNEGGGNVDDQYSYSIEKRSSQESLMLMKKIDTYVRNEQVSIYFDNQVSVHTNLISELGIFTLGDQHDYGGYLMRSKHEGQLEAGVHGGYGFLDCIAFYD
ncbi:hypothetical protein [Aliikangiella coralliicola]|nr:hypothetical protein [Aliikangiella coralliicola]